MHIRTTARPKLRWNWREENSTDNKWRSAVKQSKQVLHDVVFRRTIWGQRHLLINSEVSQSPRQCYKNLMKNELPLLNGCHKVLLKGCGVSSTENTEKVRASFRNFSVYLCELKIAFNNHQDALRKDIQFDKYCFLYDQMQRWPVSADCWAQCLILEDRAGFSNPQRSHLMANLQWIQSAFS